MKGGEGGGGEVVWSLWPGFRGSVLEILTPQSDWLWYSRSRDWGKECINSHVRVYEGEFVNPHLESKRERGTTMWDL